MDETDLAYLAAILDTQGNIRTYLPTGSKTRLAHISVSSKHRALIQHLSRVSGVRPVAASRSYQRLGCNVHCPDKHIHSVSRNEIWKVTGWRAVVILTNCLPYMRLQNEQVRVVLGEVGDADHKPATVAKMVKLGWPEVEVVDA